MEYVFFLCDNFIKEMLPAFVSVASVNSAGIAATVPFCPCMDSVWIDHNFDMDF